MSEESTETETIISEVEDEAYKAVAYILRALAVKYLPQVNDTLALNNALLGTMATIVGEMIACYPEEEQDPVGDEVVERIYYAQEMMNLEMAEEVAADEEPSKWDLASMKTQGNC